MRSPQDHVTSGLKNIGFDGGLDLKTDPVQVTPPSTTNADNVWHITNGQVRSLPSAAAAMLGSNKNVYTIATANSMPPFIGSGVLAIQESLYPSLVNPNNPSIPLSKTPCYQSNFRTRILNQSTSYFGNKTSHEMCYVTPDAAINGTSPFAVVQPEYGGAAFLVSTGDLSNDAKSSITELTLSSMRGGASVLAVNHQVSYIPGDNAHFLIVWQDISTSTGNYTGSIYIASVPYSLATAPVVYSVATAGRVFDVFIENQKVWLGYASGTGSANLRFLQLGATGAIGSVVDATNLTVTNIKGLACDFCNGVGLAIATSTATAVSAYTIPTDPWTFGTFVIGVFTPIALYSSSTYTPVYWPTIKLTKSDDGTIASAVFFNIIENITTAPATAYGVGSYGGYAYQTACARMTGNNISSLTLQALNYFRTPCGSLLTAGAFSPNYYGPSGRAGPATSTDFLAPVVTSIFENVAGVFVYRQPKYFLINSYGQICGRWADDSAGTFLAPTSAVNRKPATIVSSSDNSLVDFCIPFHLYYTLQFLSPIPVSVSGSTTVAYNGGGVPSFAGELGALAVVSYQGQNNSCPAVFSGRNTVFSGNMTMLYDGQTLHEAGFHVQPHPVIIGTTSANTNGGITISTTSGSTSATVSTTTGLKIGQAISGSGIPSGTTIIDIPNLTTITMSAAATATSAVTLTTMCQYQYVVVWRWLDAQGLVHRSAPSSPTQLNMPSSASTFGSANLGIGIPDASYKYVAAGGTAITADLYRTANTGTQFFLIASLQVSSPPPQTPSGNLNDWYLTYTDSTSDNALINPGPYSGNVTVDRLYTSADGSYSAQPPPPFVWQVSSGGRHYGLACVESFWRVYFSQQWDESSPPEFNYFAYLPVPPELGDCRSIAAYQNNILIFGTRGIATFSGSGPSRQLPLNKDGTVQNGAALASLYNGNFTLVTPLPTPAGVRGSGSPVTIPNGVVYQDRAGFMLVDGSLNLSSVGTRVEPLTGTLTQLYPFTTYGAGTLCESLAAVVWANPQGAPLVFDYNTGKWSTYSAQTYTTAFAQSQNKSLYAAKQRIAGSSLVSTDTPNVYPLSSFGATVLVETPWLSPSPSELDVGQTNSYSSNVGEGNIWEAELFGQYVNPHVLQIETAVNYGPYQLGAGWVTQFTLAAAPPQYQFRLRPPRSSRIWAIRYRISLLAVAPGTQEMARLSGIVLYSGIDTSVTRLGRSASR